MESEVVLQPGVDATRMNFVVVPSPTMRNAYRFESNYYPGAYLAWVEPNHLRVLKSIESQDKTWMDFQLVPYEKMFKYLHPTEVMIPLMPKLEKDEEGYAAISTLREHPEVVSYFHQVLETELWEMEDFAAFFDAHYQTWDCMNGKVKYRSHTEQLLLTLKQATKPEDVTASIASAAMADLECLKLSSVLRLLTTLICGSGRGASIGQGVDKLTCQKKLIAVLPAIINRTVAMELTTLTPPNIA